MNIVICDRCGKQLELEDIKEKTEKKYVIYLGRKNRHGYDLPKHLDFCVNCQKALDILLDQAFSGFPGSSIVSTIIGNEVNNAEDEAELGF